MMEIKKRNGKAEEFDREKLMQSLRKAGLTESEATRIASRIQARNGMTTDEIRARAIEELMAENTEQADSYKNTRSLRATNSNATQGYANLSQDTMNKMHINDGENLGINYAGRHRTLKARHANLNQNQIALNNDDLTALNASEGTKLAVTANL